MRTLLTERNLQSAGSFIFDDIHDPSARERLLDIAERVSSLIAASGGTILSLIDKPDDVRVATAGRPDAATSTRLRSVGSDGRPAERAGGRRPPHGVLPGRASPRRRVHRVRGRDRAPGRRHRPRPDARHRTPGLRPDGPGGDDRALRRSPRATSTSRTSVPTYWRVSTRSTSRSGRRSGPASSARSATGWSTSVRCSTCSTRSATTASRRSSRTVCPVAATPLDDLHEERGRDRARQSTAVSAPTRCGSASSDRATSPERIPRPIARSPAPTPTCPRDVDAGCGGRRRRRACRRSRPCVGLAAKCRRLARGRHAPTTSTSSMCACPTCSTPKSRAMRSPTAST